MNALGEIGVFKIVSEGAVSSGVRRVEALTGEGARAYLSHRDDMLKAAAATLKTTPDEVPARIAALVEDRRRLERELAEAKKALAMGGGAVVRPPGRSRSATWRSSARCSTASRPRGCAARWTMPSTPRRVGCSGDGRGE